MQLRAMSVEHFAKVPEYLLEYKEQIVRNQPGGSAALVRMANIFKARATQTSAAYIALCSPRILEMHLLDNPRISLSLASRIITAEDFMQGTLELDTHALKKHDMSSTTAAILAYLDTLPTAMNIRDASVDLLDASSFIRSTALTSKLIVDIMNSVYASSTISPDHQVYFDWLNDYGVEI